MADRSLQPGLYEALLTGALDNKLADLVLAAVTPAIRALADAEAADRLSRHVAMVVTRAIEALPEHGRAQAGAQGERPIAITWRLQHRLSGDLCAEFAAAVA